MVHRMKWIRRKNGEISIAPIEAKAGDTIMWDARKTTQPLALFFTDRRLFGTHQIIVSAGETKTTRIRVKEKTWAIYTYAAYFVEDGRFGEGSTPIIIVRP